MAFSSGALWLCLLLPLTGCALSPPTLTSTTSPDHGWTLTIVCEVRGDQDTLQSIEVGRGSAQPGTDISSASLGAITYSNQIRTYSNNSNISIDGHLDDGVPGSSSYLKVVIHSVGCSYDGLYYCKLSTPAGRQEFANTSVEICGDDNCLSSTVRRGWARTNLDPTSFSVLCAQSASPNSTHCSNTSLITLEVVHVDSDWRQRQLAYMARYKSDTSDVIHPVYRQRAVDTTFWSDDIYSTFWVDFGDGRCSDAGTYQCRLVYLRLDTYQLRMAISESTLSECAPGAVARVDLEGPGQERQFHCTADPALVRQLLSLEVSVVTGGKRTVLAFLSAYMNNGQPVRHTDQGHFRCHCRIDPADPAASFLTLTSLKWSGVEQVTTSCKAVYLGGDDSRELVGSFADQQFDLLW